MVLKIGDTGSLVAALQLALYRGGFLLEEPDGIFGKDTQNAVLRFQRAYGIKEDSIAGEETFSECEKYLKGYYKKTVKKGDTLWQTALDSRTTLRAILTANPDIDPERLIPGEEITVPYGFSLVPDNILYSQFLTQLLLDGLKARYPFIKITCIAKSVMGKDINAITLGEGKNSLFITAGLHANEYLNIPLVLKFSEEYLKAVIKKRELYGFDALSLFKNTSLHIVPLCNPDGLDLVTGALKEGGYYEKASLMAENYPQYPFPEGWKANINGVDLNIQFPADWERAKEIKTREGFISPSPTEFPGNAPLTQPEAAALYEYTLSNDFSMILAFHSQGEIIYWQYKDSEPENSRRIGEMLSNASGYPLEATPESSAYAGYKDWFIDRFLRPGYTVETGIGKNPLPLSQAEIIYKKNKKLILTALEETSRL